MEPTADDYVRATAEAFGLDPDAAVAYRRASTDYPLTGGQEIDSRQPRRRRRHPAEGPVPEATRSVRLSGPSGSRRESIAPPNKGSLYMPRRKGKRLGLVMVVVGSVAGWGAVIAAVWAVWPR